MLGLKVKRYALAIMSRIERCLIDVGDEAMLSPADGELCYGKVLSRKDALKNKPE